MSYSDWIRKADQISVLAQSAAFLINAESFSLNENEQKDTKILKAEKLWVTTVFVELLQTSNELLVQKTFWKQLLQAD